MARMPATVTDFGSAVRFLEWRESRKLMHNTYVERGVDGEIDVRYHGTRIVTYCPDGSVFLNTGGYRTATTKARLNAFQSVVSVYQRDFQWYVKDSAGNVTMFCDFMWVQHGTAHNYFDAPVKVAA